MTSVLDCEITGRVAVLTLNRPSRMNALSPDLRDALGAAVGRLATDRAVGAIVLTGAGRAFCAGGDIDSMDEPGLREAQARIEAAGRVARLLIAGPQPIIAAVNGVAAGAGLSLACAADHVVASTEARFCAAFSNLGLAPDWGLSLTLPARVGTVRARRMSILAEVVDAETALAIGLADELCPPSQMLERAVAQAACYAARAPLATAQIRAHALPPAALDAALAAEAARQATLFQTADHREGLAAFRARRPAQFGGH